MPSNKSKSKDQQIYPRLGLNEYPVPPPKDPCPEGPSRKAAKQHIASVRASFEKHCIQSKLYYSVEHYI